MYGPAVNMTTIEYWKAIDLYKQYRKLNKWWNDAFQVHYDGRSQIYHVALVRFGDDLGSNRWEIEPGQYPVDLIDSHKYYQLSGTLNETAYDAYGPRLNIVDCLVLAKSPGEVLANAGYWPEYDESGAQAWRWEEGPDINPATDNEVIMDRILPLLGSFEIDVHVAGIDEPLTYSPDDVDMGSLKMRFF